MRRARLLAIAALAAMVLAGGAAACDDEGDGIDGGSATPAETPEDGVSSTADVNLTEYIVSPSPESVPAGGVTFNAENIGGEDHELVVIRTDLAPDSLPTNDDGSADESGAGVEVVGEIDAFSSGTTRSATFELEAGAYVLICNVINEETGSVHYDKGMHSSFDVTQGAS